MAELSSQAVMPRRQVDAALERLVDACFDAVAETRRQVEKSYECSLLGPASSCAAMRGSVETLERMTYELQAWVLDLQGRELNEKDVAFLEARAALIYDSAQAQGAIGSRLATVLAETMRDVGELVGGTLRGIGEGVGEGLVGVGRGLGPLGLLAVAGLVWLWVRK